jgi:replicative DNA helicase
VERKAVTAVAAPVMQPASYSDEAEESVIGKLLDSPGVVGELLGEGLLPEHFYRPHNRLVFEAIVDRFYADEPVDALSIGVTLSKPIAASLQTDEQTAILHVEQLGAGRAFAGDVKAHARIVREKADGRRLIRLADAIRQEVLEGKRNAEEIAGIVGQEALKIASADTASVGEIVSLADAGRAFVRELKRAQAARDAGVELGAHFAIPAIDDATHGLQPGELLVSAGEPGIGKSAVWWRAAMNFAMRQARRPKDEQVAALILSLEMSQHPSNIRLAQAMTGIKGTQLRSGDVSTMEVEHVVREWAARREVPLFFNYAPNLRASQLRALVSEGIRRHNVGLIVVDHFRTFDLDHRVANKNDEDEDKARFLKYDLAKALNVAVVCLAHTRKKDQMASDPRPKQSDLRGSGQIAAHSDFVCFIHRPAKYASQEQIDAGEIKDTDAELLWEKNRHGFEGMREFFFEPSSMTVM